MTEEIKQGSDAWFQSRMGRVTASRVADVIAKTILLDIQNQKQFWR